MELNIMLKRYILMSVCICNFVFGGWFSKQWNIDNPPSLEESLKSLLQVNCQKVDILKGITPNSYYKNKDAISQCIKEQKFLKAIINDDVSTYKKMLDANEWSRYFLFYTTYSPRLEITPLMVSIVFNSPKVFRAILADSGHMDILSQKISPRFNIDRMMSDDYAFSGAFKLGNRIYDVNGVSALDLSAMYHRYDMFWELLAQGATYNNPKYPQTNGIVTFGDANILELMLYFDEEFLNDFGGGNILHFVTRDGNLELLEYLITQKDMPIDALKAGETPLDAALSGKNFQRKPQIQAAQKLIELGAKVSEANQHRLNKLLQKKQE